MGAFHLDMTKWVAKATNNMNTVVRQVVTGVVHGVDFRSPVGKRELWADNIDRATRGLPPVPKGYVGGHFRGNNQLGADMVPTSELSNIDPTGEMTTAANLEVIPKDAAGRVYFLVNNVPYAQALEDGHSTQAPQGIYGLTALEFQQYVDSAVAGVPK